MYRNFHNLLVSGSESLRLGENHYFFFGHFLDEPYGMMASGSERIVECWNIGHEKRKTDYPTRNVESTFFDDARKHLFSGFFR